MIVLYDCHSSSVRCTQSVSTLPEPHAPTGLAAEAESTTAVRLTWDAAGSNTFRYQYKVSTGESLSTKVDVTGTSTTVAGLSAGQQYEFYVYRVENGVESAAATVTQVTSGCSTLFVQVVECT